MMKIEKRDLQILGFLYTVSVFYAFFTGDFAFIAGVGLGYYFVLVQRYMKRYNI